MMTDRHALMISAAVFASALVVAFNHPDPVQIPLVGPERQHGLTVALDDARIVYPPNRLASIPIPPMPVQPPDKRTERDLPTKAEIAADNTPWPKPEIFP